MPDIKKMEGPVKFKTGVELYFDPKKDMFYDPKKKKYMSEKDILALEEVELGQELNEELQTDFEKSSFLKAYKGVLKMNGKEVWTSLPAQYKSSADAVKAAKHFKSLLDKHGYKMVSGSLEASDKAKKMMDDYDEKNAKHGKPSTTMGEETELEEYYHSKKKKMEEGDKEEYQKFFQSALKRFGVKSPSELKGDKKKEFFDYVDKNWEGENEEDEEETIEEAKFKTLDVWRELFKKYVDKKQKTPHSIAYKKLIDAMFLSGKKKDIQDAYKNLEKLTPGAYKEFKDYAMKVAKSMVKEEKEFKPHMMYDPKTGKGYKADTEEDHERMKKLGYTHEKPKSIEELSLEEAIAEAKEWKVGAPVFIVISYHTNGKHSTTVLRTKEKAMKFAKDEEDHEDDVKGTAVLDMKVGKFINKETGKHIKEQTELSEKMQNYVDACGKDFTNYSLKEGKKDYEIYHKTFTSAVEEVEKFAEKNGYEIDSDEMFNKVGTGPKKPSVGKTNEYHLTLMKNGKEDRKKLHFQVYGMKSQYELNMYIS